MSKPKETFKSFFRLEEPKQYLLNIFGSYLFIYTLKMLSLQAYNTSSDEEVDDNRSDEPGTIEALPTELTKYSIKKDLQVCATPVVLPPAIDEDNIHIHPDTKELQYNPKFDELFAPTVGPVNPFKTQQEAIERNILSGKVIYELIYIKVIVLWYF